MIELSELLTFVQIENELGIDGALKYLLITVILVVNVYFKTKRAKRKNSAIDKKQKELEKKYNKILHLLKKKK